MEKINDKNALTEYRYIQKRKRSLTLPCNYGKSDFAELATLVLFNKV